MIPIFLALSGLASASEPGALDRALAAVDAGDVCADVRFLAADELQGRDTPSQGLRLAARYLRARVERLGFRPAGDRGFFDVYTLERGGLDAERSKAWLVRAGAEQELRFGRDYTFWGGGEHELEGPVVFVGEARAEDLQGLDLKGKW